MKAALRKQLRGQRRSLSGSEHRHRSLRAAKGITRLRFFRAGCRVALLAGATDPGAYGISVPRRRLTPISAQWLDLIVVPLVGIDGEGRRLGLGAGYYDRALAFRQRRRCWKGPHLVGLAFDCQRTNVNFADAWDVRLDSLATESGVEHYL